MHRQRFSSKIGDLKFNELSLHEEMQSIINQYFDMLRNLDISSV